MTTFCNLLIDISIWLNVSMYVAGFSKEDIIGNICSGESVSAMNCHCMKSFVNFWNIIFDLSELANFVAGLERDI